MSCDVCDGKLNNSIIYENDNIIITLANNPCTSGHVQIFPRKHFTIIEELPSELLNYMSLAANKISMILFESLKVHGTNILVQNGIPAGQNIPHMSMHIIPRRSDDGLKIDWDMKQASAESLENMQRIISEGVSVEETEEKIEENKDHSKEEDKETQDINSVSSASKTENIQNTGKKTDYWLKTLERIP